MRAFPEDALLSRVLARGELEARHIDALAHGVAAFHGRIAIAPPQGLHGMPEEILVVALEVFAEIEPLLESAEDRARLDRLRAWTQREHAARAASLRERLQSGFVRECHGDLHLGNIALIDGTVTVFDGIEFSERLRSLGQRHDDRHLRRRMPCRHLLCAWAAMSTRPAPLTFKRVPLSPPA